jgi:CheY-like chemotaxis protein
VVITDHLMEALDGAELALLIRAKDEKKRKENNGKTTIVCVSAMSGVKSAVRADFDRCFFFFFFFFPIFPFLQVFDACLLKPTTLDGMRDALSDFLN